VVIWIFFTTWGSGFKKFLDINNAPVVLVHLKISRIEEPPISVFSKSLKQLVAFMK